MGEKRSFSAGSMVPTRDLGSNHFFITGGIDYHIGSTLSSTEFITEDGVTYEGNFSILGDIVT